MKALISNYRSFFCILKLENPICRYLNDLILDEFSEQLH